MAIFFRGNTLLKNSEFVSSEMLPENQDKALYEVLRVIDHVPVFWREHFERLIQTAEIADVSLKLDQFQFSSSLKKLIKKIGYKTGNIRVLITGEQEKGQSYFYFVPHGYPSVDDYSHGVKLGLLKAERIQPQAKVIQQELRKKANQLILNKEFHEVLLMNNQEQITEGSRSNVFFVKGSTFITPPANQVLKGITRTKVIECIRQMDYDVVEDVIAINELKKFDSIFITGTSPKVLPVSQVDNLLFNTSNQHVNKLMIQFDEMIQTEIEENRSLFCS